MNLVRSRDPLDCVICSLAMVLGRSYEDVNNLFPRRRDQVGGIDRGITDSEFTLAAYRLGYALIWLQSRTRDSRGVVVEIDVADTLKNELGLIVVHNKVGRHLVAWDGKMVYDPGKWRPQLLSSYMIEGLFVVRKLN